MYMDLFFKKFIFNDLKVLILSLIYFQLVICMSLSIRVPEYAIFFNLSSILISFNNSLTSISGHQIPV